MAEEDTITDLINNARTSHCDLMYLYTAGLIVDTDRMRVDMLEMYCESGHDYYYTDFLDTDIMYVTDNFVPDFRKYVYERCRDNIEIPFYISAEVIQEVANISHKLLIIENSREKLGFPRYEMRDNKIVIIPEFCTVSHTALENASVDFSYVKAFVTINNPDISKMPKLEYLCSRNNITVPEGFKGIAIIGDDYYKLCEDCNTYNDFEIYDLFLRNKPVKSARKI